MSVTVGDMVRKALRLAEVIDHTEEPDADQFFVAYEALVDMLNDWVVEHGLDWLERDGFIELVPGRHVYRFGPEGDFPFYVTEFMTQSIGGPGCVTDVNITKVERQQYRDKPNKANVGRPTEYMSAKADQFRDVYFWPVPNAPYVFSFSYRGLLDIPDDPKAILPIPVNWERCVKYNLALEMVTEFGLVNDRVDGIAIALKQKQLEKSQEGGEVRFTVGRR